MDTHICNKESQLLSMGRSIHAVEKVLLGDLDTKQPGLLEEYRGLMCKMTEVLQRFQDQKENNKWFWREIVSGFIGAMGGVAAAFILFKVGVK